MNHHQGIKKSSEELFQEGLEIVLHGESTEEFLEQHPDSATELRSLLSLASQVRDAVAVEPRPEARAAALEHMLASAQAQSSSPYFWLRALISLPRAFSAAAASLLLLVLTSAGALVASASALPGEPLYPVKTGVEHIQLAIILDEGARAQTYAALATRRTNEIAELNRQGRPVLPETVTALSQQTSAAVTGMEAVAAKEEPGDAETLGQTLVDLTNRQQEVLSTVAATAPDAAKPALRKALEVSQKEQERARKAVEKARERKADREEEREKQKGTATAQPGDRERGRNATGDRTPTPISPTPTPRGGERGRTVTPDSTPATSPGVAPPHEENQSRGRERAEAGAPPTIRSTDASAKEKRSAENEQRKDREEREREREDARRGEHRDRDADAESGANQRGGHG